MGYFPATGRPSLIPTHIIYMSGVRFRLPAGDPSFDDCSQKTDLPHRSHDPDFGADRKRNQGVE